MAFSPLAVANYLLDLADGEGISLSPMKLQKLVFYCHGWHLAFLHEPLLDEQIECWRYGPVIESLFHQFKAFGSDAITRRGTTCRYTADGWAWREPQLPAGQSPTKEVIDAVWNAYKGYSATKLSNMTHEADGPWRRVVEKYNGRVPKGTDIPEEWIEEYFKHQIGK